MPTMDRLERAGKAFSKELAAHGITSFGGVVQFGTDGIAGQAGAIEVPLMELLIKHQAIDQDVVFYIVTGKPKQLARADKAIRKAAENNGRFVVGGIKLYADGSFGARTAAMYEPYSDSASGECGFMVRDHASLLGIFKETHELGRQIIIHAIGDKANREVVDVFKVFLKGTKNVHHHRIEHASTLTPDTIADIAELGIILACQPAFINSEVTWLEKRVGPDRLKRTYAFKSMLDSGIVLAGASDAPIESVHVFKAIQACVTRRGLVPSERISVLDALRVFTMNSAIAINQENVKGSLEPGKLADFIIINKDPLRVPQDELETILVKETYHRGLRIFP
jgi:predicted amidohydrolase YtcJ